MLNSNSGLDHSSARAFGSSFPAGQNQNGANAFGLAGESCSVHVPKTCNLGKVAMLSTPGVQGAYQDSRITTCRPAYKIGKFYCCCCYLARTDATIPSRLFKLHFSIALDAHSFCAGNLCLAAGKPCYTIAIYAKVQRTSSFL